MLLPSIDWHGSIYLNRGDPNLEDHAKSVACRCGHRYAIPLLDVDPIARGTCEKCGATNFVSHYERIDLGLSEVCNLTCLMCRRPQEKVFMPAEQVHALLEDAVRIGVRTVSFSGGEPFVHPHFRAFLGKAIDLGLDVELVTNGTLVRKQDIELLERLKCVTVSIDGPEAVHDYVRGRTGAYRSTMGTVSLLASSRAKWGTNTVIQAANAERLRETWDVIRRHGAPSYVSFNHVEVVPETTYLLPSESQSREAQNQLDYIKAQCDEQNVHFNDAALHGENSRIFEDKKKRYQPLNGCEIPRTFLGVSQWGIFPCWHQGRAIAKYETLISALETDLCRDIVSEGLNRLCIGCNATNYSWNQRWVDGVAAAHQAGQWLVGVVYLSEGERAANKLRAGKRTLPIIERREIRA